MLPEEVHGSTYTGFTTPDGKYMLIPCRLACRATEHACRATSMRAERRACVQSHGARVQSHEHACRATEHACRATEHACRATEHACRATEHACRATCTRAEPRARVQSHEHTCRATSMRAEGTCHCSRPHVEVPDGVLRRRVRTTWLNFKCLSAKQRYDQAFCLDLQQERVRVCPNNSLFR